MISYNHYLELYIAGQLIELESQDSLNLRINNVLFNPTKTTTTQAEYSYTFELPSTPNNDKILNYANNLSRLNKFHTRYKAQVYADGHKIFDGSLTIQKYNAKEKKYECNLVNIKINTLEDIFGETKMTDLHWDVYFDGAPTINEINANSRTKYYFPLVSYGVFQKNWKTKDDVAAEYTPKHDIDKYNKWWIESFYPSLNVMETVKRAFKEKGYDAVGSAFSDCNINSIFASCQLAQEQDPVYNLGHPKFGELSLTTTWNNYSGSGSTPQSLNYPYNKVTPAINANNGTSEARYNFSDINFWNMCDSTTNSNVHVTLHQDTYMYDPGEHLFVIPADGWYKINLTCKATLSGAGTTFETQQWTTTFKQGDEFTLRPVNLTRTLLEHTPLEIQLIRNYDENIELIKGKKNIEYATGDPNQETYRYQGAGYTATTEYTNKTEWNTEYPHQDLGKSKSPTKTEGLVISTVSERKGGWSPTDGTSAGGTFGGSGLGRGRNNQTQVYTNVAASYGYMHKAGSIMPYDQAVSPAFICGFSSLDNGVVSVMKNGDSWTKMCSITNHTFAKVNGLDLVSSSGTSETNYCANEYLNSQYSIYANQNTLSGTVQCCVYLNKNDILELVAVQRGFNGSGGFGGGITSVQGYACSATCDLHITAMNNKSYETLKADPNWNYYSTTEFPTKLNLFNFTNKETKVSDWLTNIQKAFNLEYVMDGNTVEINTNQGIKKNLTYAVELDNRVNSDEAVSEYISYPRQMSVQYKTDTDEWGFWTTVPVEYHNTEESVWKAHGDSGYTIIQLNDDTYETSTQNTSTQFSYTWYDNFNFQLLSSSGTPLGGPEVISIPVIEKYDYMAEGYSYEESMKHDGYSLAQRFWFRDQVTQDYIYLSSIKANGTKEYIDLTYPVNFKGDFNLSYKDTEKSIVTEYFNIYPMLSSNYVTVEAYITPDEYNDIKGGALVHFDSDLYYTSEIQGFDATGNNPTTLKLIKRV